MRKARLSHKKIKCIAEALDRHYPRTELGNQQDPLHEAIFILLSSQTDEKKYSQTWSQFTEAFPSVEAAKTATEADLYRAIQAGGLGRWKSRRIANLLEQVADRYGELSLSSLASLDDDALEHELIQLDGIGIKSARCIMMYSFGRAVFPVDVHIARVTKRLGFRIPRVHVRTRKFADGIQQQVPVGTRHRLHVNLIQHGRAICRPTKPKCDACVLNSQCWYWIGLHATDAAEV